MIRTLVVLAVVAMTVVGGLYVALPPNYFAANGPADPIRRLRRPVMRVLHEIGLADDDRCSVRGCRGYRKTADGRIVLEMHLLTETVYRGLVWPVGQRVTCFYFGDAVGAWRALRLCYVVDGERFLAAETTDENGSRNSEVTGFVPRAASGFWTEQAGGNGGVQVDGWGDTVRSR